MIRKYLAKLAAEAFETASKGLTESWQAEVAHLKRTWEAQAAELDAIRDKTYRNVQRLQKYTEQTEGAPEDTPTPPTYDKARARSKLISRRQRGA